MAALRPPCRVRGALLACAGTLLVLGLAGCVGFFRPAQPEPPTNTGFIPSYADPNQTLDALSGGIADKARSNGLSVYLGGLADPQRDAHEFQATIDPAVVQLWEQSSGRTAPTWTLALEQNFYGYLVGLRSNDDYVMQWEEDPTQGDDVLNLAAGEATLHRKYTLLAISPDGSTARTIAIGYATLNFIKGGAGHWVITQWQDRVDPKVGANPSNPDSLSMGRRRLDSQ